MKEENDPRKIILVNEKNPMSSWDKVEKISKIISFVGIPLVIALLGMSFNKQQLKETVNKDFVNIAIRILSDPNVRSDRKLRKWATEMVNLTAPIPLPKDVTNKLNKGELFLPQTKAYEGWEAWKQGDFKKAAELHYLAAKAGNRAAQYRMGLHYQRGLYTQTNYVEAVNWHKKAAKQGSSGSMDELSSIFETGGYGITKNLVQANKWIILGIEAAQPVGKSEALIREMKAMILKRNRIESKLSEGEKKKAQLLAGQWSKMIESKQVQ